MAKKDKDEFWADVKAEAVAAIEKPAPADLPVLGCTCSASERPCGWCSLTEAERERKRNESKS